MHYFLRSRRLGWRCWQDTDLSLATALWGNREVTRHIVAGGVMSAREIALRLAAERALEQAHGVQYWPMFLLADGRFIGCCGLRPEAHEAGVLELGFHIDSAHWRCGFALEAAATVIEFAFTKLAAPALFAGHNPENLASAAVLAKLGFCYTHHAHYAPTGRQHPSYRLSAEAWRSPAGGPTTSVARKS